MAEQSKSVFYGAGNVGEAVTYQREAPNLFELMAKKGEEQKEQKVQQAKTQAQTAKDLEITWKEIWHPAQNQLMQDYDNFSKKYIDLVKQGKQNDPETQLLVQEEKARLDQNALKSKQYESAIKEFQNNSADLKKQGLKPDQTMTFFLNSIKNEDGTNKPIEEWDLSILEDYKKDPNNWDYPTVVTNIMDAIGTETSGKTRVEGGWRKYEEQEIPSYIRVDKKGKILRDGNGDPIIDVTPELANVIKGTEGANVLVEKILLTAREQGDENFTYTDAVEAFLKSSTKIKSTEKWSADEYSKIAYQSKVGAENELADANNFLKQMSSLFNGSFKLKPTSPVTTNDGRVLQEVVSPFDGKEVGKFTDRDGKAKTITGSVYYDASSGNYYLKKSHNFKGEKNENDYELLDKTTLPKIVEGFNDKRYSNAISHPRFNWLTEENNFNPEKANETLRAEAVEAKTTAKTEEERVKTTVQNTKNWINTYTQKGVELVDKIGSTVLFDDEDLTKLNNEVLSKYPTDVNIDVKVADGVSKTLYNPKISINVADEMINIEAFDENGEPISTSIEYTPTTMKSILQPKPNIKKYSAKLGDKRNYKTETQPVNEISDEELMKQYGL